MGKNNESILGHNLVGWFNCLFTHHIKAKIKSSCDFLIFNFIPIYTLLRSDVQIDFFFVHFSQFQNGFVVFPQTPGIHFFFTNFHFCRGMDHVSRFIEFFLTRRINFVFHLCEWVFHANIQFLFINMDGWIQTMSDRHSHFT